MLISNSWGLAPWPACVPKHPLLLTIMTCILPHNGQMARHCYSRINLILASSCEHATTKKWRSQWHATYTRKKKDKSHITRAPSRNRRPHLNITCRMMRAWIRKIAYDRQPPYVVSSTVTKDLFCGVPKESKTDTTCQNHLVAWELQYRALL